MNRGQQTVLAFYGIFCPVIFFVIYLRNGGTLSMSILVVGMYLSLILGIALTIYTLFALQEAYAKRIPNKIKPQISFALALGYTLLHLLFFV